MEKKPHVIYYAINYFTNQDDRCDVDFAKLRSKPKTKLFIILAVSRRSGTRLRVKAQR